MREVTRLANREGTGELAWLAAMKALGTGIANASTMAENASHCPDRVRIILKSAIGATTADELGIDVRIVSSAFLESLREASLFDYAMPLMRRVPRRTRIVSTTLMFSGSSVAEGAWKPVGKLGLAGVTLVEQVAVALAVFTEETIRLAVATGAMGLIQTELRRAAVAATDAKFLSILATAGGAPIVSSGDDAAAIYADIATLLAALPLTAESVPVLAIPPILSQRLAVMVDADGRRLFPEISPTSGGTIANIPTRVTDALADDVVIAFDASRVAADAGVILPAVSSHASLKMDTAPGAGAGALVSLFQTNSKAVRVERLFGAEVIGDDVVANLSGVGWGLASS